MVYSFNFNRETKMSVPVCDWCGEDMPNGPLIETSHGDFCSFSCREEDEFEVIGRAGDDEFDGQPSELTEWLDFDPDC